MMVDEENKESGKTLESTNKEGKKCDTLKRLFLLIESKSITGIMMIIKMKDVG